MSLFVTEWADGQKVKPTVLGLKGMEIVTQDIGATKGITSGCDVCGQTIEVGQPIVKIAFGRYHADCVDWSD